MSVVDQVSKSPTCPLCSNPMKRRSGKNGDFWGCMRFPDCRGTRQLNVDLKDFHKTEYAPITKMPGSDEQEAIWKCMTTSNTHIIVNASPGTGKTFVGIQGCLRLPKKDKILFVAFNKHIAKEANGKLAASGCSNVKASTYHSMGYNILRKQFKTLGAPDENKMQQIFESLSPEPAFNKSQWRKTLNLAEKLANLTKHYLIDYKRFDFRDEMERIADHHGMEFQTTATGAVPQFPVLSEAVDLIPAALNECKKRVSVSIDYNDMIWLPVILELPFDPVDMIITDEAQDLDLLQHEMTLRAGFAGRVVIVGDKNQAIYGWRGAATGSMEILTEALRKTPRGVSEFPLTITRRCPKIHVQMAQYLFPNIQALDDAPLGEVSSVKQDKAIESMKIGDLVLCRINKELIKAAYKLIKRGVRPSIKGRDIGKGLLGLLDTLVNQATEKTQKQFYGGAPGTAMGPGAITTQMLAAQLDSYRFDQESKLIPLGDKAAGRIETLHEKCDCVSEFISNSLTIEEIRQSIATLFSDDENPANCVTLGTVHRTKGLEAERVYILAPELIPHPMAKKPWEITQERNIAWIAITRAKFNNKTGAPGSVIFCGPIPEIYNGSARVAPSDPLAPPLPLPAR